MTIEDKDEIERINNYSENDCLDEIYYYTNRDRNDWIAERHDLTMLIILFERLIILTENSVECNRYKVDQYNRVFQDLKYMYYNFFTLKMAEINKDIRTILRNKLEDYNRLKVENDMLKKRVKECEEELADIYQVVESFGGQTQNGDCNEQKDIVVRGTSDREVVVNGDVITNITRSIPSRSATFQLPLGGAK